MGSKLLDQLEDVLGRDSEITQIEHHGIRRMISALLVRGLRDLDNPDPLERADAIHWWFSKEKRWIFSSAVSCSLLGLEITAMRDFILHNWPEVAVDTGWKPRTPSGKFYHFSRPRLHKEEDD